jgi:hypothetical protein
LVLNKKHIMLPVVFFDDSPNNIREFNEQHPWVITVLVDAQRSKTFADHCHHILSQHGGNQFARSLQKNPLPAAVGPGVDLAEVERVVTDASANLVMFDWDLTLSTCNGLHLNHKKMSPLVLRDAAIFYAGGPDRFQGICTMLQKLRQKNIKVLVLTDNGTADRKEVGARRNFVRLLQCMDPAFTEDDLVYGNLDKARIFHEDILPKFQKNPLILPRRGRTRRFQTMPAPLSPRTARYQTRCRTADARVKIESLVRENAALREGKKTAPLAALKDLARRLDLLDSPNNPKHN